MSDDYPFRFECRPEKCRTWPFWPEMLARSDLLAEARRVCPGIVERDDHGQVHCG